MSYIITGRSPAARARLEKARIRVDEEACVSIITVGEIFYGLEKIGAGAQRRRALELFFDTISARLWDHDAAAAYGRLRAEQERVGKPLGPYDMQIAAHAVALGATLVSHDAGSGRSPGWRGWKIGRGICEGQSFG